MKERCIIFGGAGFIGSHIAEDLLQNNMNVTIFDKLNASRKNIKSIENNIEFIEGDFINEVDLSKALKGKQFVVHLVSTTVPATSNQNMYYDIESNLISSIHLLKKCSENKIKRIVFISSGGTVYGNPITLPIKENHPTNPVSSYGIIKLTIEKYLYLFNVLNGLDYKILRFSNPYGERQNPLITQGLIAHLLHLIYTERKIEIWGDGKVIRDYFYIRDGAKAIYKALKDKSSNKIYNISSGKGLSVNQILSRFRQVLKLDFKVKYTEARKFDVTKNILDNSLANKYLNWKPEVSFNEGLKRTWSYIIDNK